MKPRCLRCGSFEVTVWEDQDVDCGRCWFGWLRQADGWPPFGNPMGYERTDEFGNPGWVNVPYGCMAVWGEL